MWSLRLRASTVVYSSLYDISTYLSGVNTYAADVPGVDVGSHINLCAKSQPSGEYEAYMRLQKLLISPNLTLILWAWQGVWPKFKWPTT